MSQSDDILLHVSKECRRHGVKFVISAQPYVMDDCIGWFSEVPDTKIGEHELVIATGRDEEDWLSTLLHERGHMHQWIEDPEGFRRSDVLEGNVFKWIAREIELTDAEADEACRASMLIELDAERRALLAFKEFGLSIDPVIYAQKGNAYGHFYTAARRFRRWYDKDKSPYRNDQIRCQFPVVIDPNWKIPDSIMKLYEGCL